MIIGCGRCFSAFLVLLVAAAPLSGQSLGDLARQEEARRATAEKAVRSFSNADLHPSEIASTLPSDAATASCYMSISRGTCVSAEELLANTSASIVSAERAKEEAVWRDNAKSIRAPLEALQHELLDLEKTAADEGRSPGERASARRQIEQREAALAVLEGRWQRFEKDADDRRVPRAWLEPIPVLFLRTPQ